MARGSTDIEASDDAENLHQIFDLRFLTCDLGVSRSARRSKIENQKSKISPIVHAKYGVGVVLVPDLVHGFAASLARVEPVWAIDHEAVAVADILISVHDAFGNDDRLRIISAHREGHNFS